MTIKKTDYEERLTTATAATTKKTDHEEDWEQYTSALFWLTRTHPCATFGIHGHVWAESFVVLPTANGLLGVLTVKQRVFT